MNNTTEFAFTFPAESSNQSETRFWVIAPFVCLILTTCSTNALIMILVTKDNSLKSVTYKYVFSLAVSDFLLGLIVMSGMMMYTVYGYWPLHSSLGTLWISIDIALCGTSVFHLCIISYDRFLATVHPLSTHLQDQASKEKWARIKICAAWVAGILAGFPSSVVIRHKQLTQGEVPVNECNGSTVYHLAHVFVVLYIPITVMSYFYIRVFYALYQNKKNLEKALKTTEQQRDQSSNEENISASTKTDDVSGAVARAKDKTNERQKRANRTLGMISVVFLLCWLPFGITVPFQFQCGCVNSHFFEFTYWATYLNSTFNPILYFIVNTDVRNAAKRLLCKNRAEKYESGSDNTESSRY